MIFYFTAVSTTDASRRKGEIASESAAAARAALRQSGLQVLSIRPVPVVDRSAVSDLRQAWRRHLRARRRWQRAELYDSVATLLDSGLPLLECLDTAGCKSPTRSIRSVARELHEAIRSGSSLGAAMRARSDWFEPTEVSMVDAAQHSGDLPLVLRTLAVREERSSELHQKLINAIAYPMIVACVALGVVVFISTRTLPDLAQILWDADIEVPALTLVTMRTGQLVASYWWAFGLLLGAGWLGVHLVRRALKSGGISLPNLKPRVFRRVALAEMSARLSELLSCGIPFVDAVRITAPTVGSDALRATMLNAADKLERGEEISGALNDEAWFDPEFRRLLDVSKASGELEVLLARIADRYSRSARRHIDRLALLLEPVAILLLATLIGIVVIAAVLPITKLQEII